MDPTHKPISLTVQTLALVPFIFFLPCFKASSSDHNTLVYKNCKLEPTLNGNAIPSRPNTLFSFFKELKTHSTRSKFYKTVSGDENFAVSGLFQCRGDLSNEACHRCIENLHKVSNDMCRNATSARFQFQGCYFKYKAEMFDVNDGNELLETPEHEPVHKVCHSDHDGAKAFPGFEEMRDAALVASEAGVMEGGGFYTSNHELFHVVAQCEGDGRDVCGCGECVGRAVAAVEEECGWAVSGQVYLDGCYVGYTFYPHGVPGHLYHDEDESAKTGKSLAIVLGVAAALAFCFIFLMFLKSLKKKDDDC